MKDLFGFVIPQQLEFNFESQEKEEDYKTRSVSKPPGTGALQLSETSRKRATLRNIFAPVRTT